MKQDAALKRDIVSRVVGSAIYILENSYLRHSNLWPAGGIKLGTGMGENKREYIFIVVNAWGFKNIPVQGTFCLWLNTKSDTKYMKQHKHLRLILDFAIHDGVFFEDRYRELEGYDLWFTFTIQE